MFSPPTGATGATAPTQGRQPIPTPPTSNRATGLPSLAGSSAPVPDSGYSTPLTSAASAAAFSVGSPIHPLTNPSSFHSLLSTHRAVIAMFTSATCPPCRMIEPVFEDLARSKKNGQIAFVKVNSGVGMGSMVACEYGVTATPTFGFFLVGKKARDMWLGHGLDWLMSAVGRAHPQAHYQVHRTIDIWSRGYQFGGSSLAQYLKMSPPPHWQANPLAFYCYYSILTSSYTLLSGRPSGGSQFGGVR